MNFAVPGSIFFGAKPLVESVAERGWVGDNFGQGLEELGPRCAVHRAVLVRAFGEVAHLAGARAYGPLLQGTAGVIHDLSRGCSADEIATVAVIAACQAAKGRP